jgi:16S rRNA (adenine1518-N6/adenine1519-N6)-dimethyltransferase
MHAHQPRKRFGQNFLKDQNVITKIINVVSPKKNDHFVEIGPGLGALTLALLPHVSRLDAIEIDRDLVPKLKANAVTYSHILNVHEADALCFDFNSLRQGDEKIRIIGNLPYNISSPLIFHVIKFISIIKDLHFMLQKEVAERLVAMPGSKDYGRLSVMVQYHCKTELLFAISPEHFTPKPKVYSAFISLEPIQKRDIMAENFNLFENIVREAFNHRRKTIRNALKNIVTGEDFGKMGIDSDLRPEDLSVDDFIKISNYTLRLSNCGFVASSSRSSCT